MNSILSHSLQRCLGIDVFKRGHFTCLGFQALYLRGVHSTAEIFNRESGTKSTYCRCYEEDFYSREFISSFDSKGKARMLTLDFTDFQVGHARLGEDLKVWKGSGVLFFLPPALPRAAWTLNLALTRWAKSKHVAVKSV